MTKNKILVALCLLFIAFTLPALASTDDPSDPSSKNLANLNYYVHRGDLLLEPTYTSEFHDVSTNSQPVSVSALNLLASYGLLIDGLRIGLSEANSITATGGTFYRSGLNDPTLNINYRLVDDAPGGWSADVQATISPSFLHAYSSYAGNAGTNARGYGTVELSGALFWRMGMNEAKLGGGATLQFSGNMIDTQNTDFSYTRTSTWTGDVYITDRLHICPRFYVDAQAELYFGYTPKYNYAGGDTGSSTIPLHVEPLLKFGYLANKQLALEAYTTYFSYNGTFSSSDGTNTSTLYQGLSWAVDARMEF